MQLQQVFAIPASSGSPGVLVMKADATVADAFVSKTLGSDQSEAWLTFDIAMDAAALALFTTDEYSGDIGDLHEVGGFNQSQVSFWAEPAFASNNWGIFRRGGSPNVAEGPDAIAADTWFTCELHFKVSDIGELYINSGTAMATGTGLSTLIKEVRVGLQFADWPGNAIIYVRDVKVGTTRGASDLFADDFSSGNTSNWDTTTGTCTVVADPYP